MKNKLLSILIVLGLVLSTSALPNFINNTHVLADTTWDTAFQIKGTAILVTIPDGYSVNGDLTVMVHNLSIDLNGFLNLNYTVTGSLMNDNGIATTLYKSAYIVMDKRVKNETITTNALDAKGSSAIVKVTLEELFPTTTIIINSTKENNRDKNGDNSSIPQTGDKTPVELLTALMLISTTALVFLIPEKRRI